MVEIKGGRSRQARGSGGSGDPRGSGGSRDMNGKMKKGLVLIIEVTLVILTLLFSPYFPESAFKWLGSWSNIFSIACVFIGGIPVLIETIKALMRKDLTADILFIIALSATEYIGRDMHIVAATLILMMGSGEFIEEFTIEKTFERTSVLMDLVPTRATVKIQGTGGTDGAGYQIKEISMDEVNLGDIIIVKPGDRIPVDGTITRGNAEVDASLITGENRPVIKREGENVRSGMLVLDGPLEIKTVAKGDESSIGKISSLIQFARMNKSRMQSVTDKWAQVFAPLIITIAITTWIFTNNLFYTISILLVSCPCSLVLSVPTAFIGTLGNAAKKGIWIKSGEVIENVGRTNLLVLDKTGTLTYGLPEIKEVLVFHDYDRDRVEKIAQSLEVLSNHPIAKSIAGYFHEKRAGKDVATVTDFSILPGLGIRGHVEGEGIAHAGNEFLLKHLEIDSSSVLSHPNVMAELKTNYVVFITLEDEILGAIIFKDTIKKGIKDTIARIRKLGVSNIAILTGDMRGPADEMREFTGSDIALSRLTPNDKLRFIEEAKTKSAIITMVGDGINDAPALALSDVGIAMGKNGAALAVEQADVILMDDDFEKVGYVIMLGKRCVRKAMANILLSILFNFFGILLSATGFLVPIGASLWHVVQSLVVVGNSSLLLRTLKF
ncbi:MAG: heavy metal translocating P-type ATPase [Promethearchaeota archaeon]